MRPLRFAIVAAALFAHAAAAGGEGRVEPAGGYLSAAPASTISRLPDGSFLLYGFGPQEDERLAQHDLTAALRARRDARAIATPDPGPRLWDARARGWRRLPLAPECDGFLHYFHTATVLADGRVLIAGGLCDVPKMADDPSPWAAHTKLSLWDGGARKWVPAPALHDARIHHTATPVPDGSVLIAGGESDPALVREGEPVIASVERFTGNDVEVAPPLLQARARHTATALADGTLVVAGGFGADGRALASVEVLSPGARTWRALPPMREARHSHTATLLADGRILVVGGKDGQERALESSETWDPARNEWIAGPQLPVALNGHAAARLANGDVLVAGGAWIASPLAPIPWAWTWSPAGGEWRVAGHAITPDAVDLSAGVTIAPLPGNVALLFTPRTILRWVAGGDAQVPPWDTKPSIAALKGARAMIVGYENGAPTNGAMARVWDAAANRWSAAGMPFNVERMEGATAQLPSGRVIHVGVNMDNTLVCRTWDPPERWEDCGSVKLEYAHRGQPQLGSLPDGRAFAIVGEHEAAVLDEGSRTWTRTRLEWDRTNFAQGAPVLHDKPYASLVDPANGTAIAIDDAAARYYNASLSGGIAAMLHDAKASRWAYVFLDRRMGADAQWLPDGCALSTSPLALFDPKLAEARSLPDPGIGIAPHQGAMAVLDDGTVVIAGVGAAGAGGFFQRKASCAGFASTANDGPYIAPDLVRDDSPVVVGPAVAPAGEQGSSGSRLASTWAKVFEHRWLILAIAAPLALYLLLRRTRVGKTRAPASRGFRIAIYAIIAVVLAPFVLQYVLFYVVTSSNRCAESPLQCKSDPPWWVGLARMAKPAAAPQCKMVGVWSSQRGGRANPIELKDDGTYAMSVDGRRYTGLWRLEGDKMTWQHEQMPGVRDVNAIEFAGDTRFTLTEENGQLTRYELIRPTPSNRCAK